MKNTLKTVLLLLGILLSLYGLLSLFYPELLMLEILSSSDNTKQAVAILALGVLTLLSGLGFKKR